MKRTATFLLSSLLSAPLFAADPAAIVGKFAPGERYTEPQQDAPAAVSRMYVRSANGKSAVGGLDLPATGGSGLIVLMLPVGKNARMRHAGATMKTPTGEALRSSDWGSTDRGIQRFVVDAAGELGIEVAGSTQEVIHVDRTDAASYRLSLPEMADDSGMLVVAGEPDSTLTLTTSVGPLSRHAGEPVTLRAIVRDGDAPVLGANVTARLAARGSKGGQPIALFDDGRHGDGAKDDGEYAAIVTDLPTNEHGFWAVRYDADGTTAHGVAFARSGASAFMNERTSARLDAKSIRATVENGVLHVRANADVEVAGNYRFDVIVASPKDSKGERQGIAWGEAARALGSGGAELALDVPLGADVDADSLFLDIRLLSLDSMGVAGRVTREGAGK